MVRYASFVIVKSMDSTAAYSYCAVAPPAVAGMTHDASAAELSAGLVPRHLTAGQWMGSSPVLGEFASVTTALSSGWDSAASGLHCSSSAVTGRNLLLGSLNDAFIRSDPRARIQSVSSDGLASWMTASSVISVVAG